MAHEQGETVSRSQDGRTQFQNVYGRQTPQAGQPLAPIFNFERPTYPNVDEAVKADIMRSMLSGRAGTRQSGADVIRTNPAPADERYLREQAGRAYEASLAPQRPEGPRPRPAPMEPARPLFMDPKAAQPPEPQPILDRSDPGTNPVLALWHFMRDPGFGWEKWDFPFPNRSPQKPYGMKDVPFGSLRNPLEMALSMGGDTSQDVRRFYERRDAPKARRR